MISLFYLPSRKVTVCTSNQKLEKTKTQYAHICLALPELTLRSLIEVAKCSASISVENQKLQISDLLFATPVK